MKLTEEQIRAKVRELYLRKSQKRMDIWIWSGIQAGVLDGELVEQALNEELANVPAEVRAWWLQPCELCQSGKPHAHSGGFLN